MKAKHLMSQHVVTCLPETTLHDAAHAMWSADIGCLVVADASRTPLGVITDRDIAMAAYTQGVPLRSAQVSSAMASELITCSLDTSLAEIETLMHQRQIRRVPVVDAQGKLAGIVTLADIARSAQRPSHITEIPALARTLAGITERRTDRPSSEPPPSMGYAGLLAQRARARELAWSSLVRDSASTR